MATADEDAAATATLELETLRSKSTIADERSKCEIRNLQSELTQTKSEQSTLSVSHEKSLCEIKASRDSLYRRLNSELESARQLLANRPSSSNEPEMERMIKKE